MKWNTGLYEGKHDFVWRYGQQMLEFLDPRPGEMILDLGCGPGQLTAQIAESGAIVEGVDASAPMIEQARENYPELSFRVADGTNFVVEQPLDAVFSNAALHWMKPPEKVVHSISKALKPNGRLVVEFGGRGNCGSIVETLDSVCSERGYPLAPDRNPFYFPTSQEYTELLTSAGFKVELAHLYDRPTKLAGDVTDWCKMFGERWLVSVPESDRKSVLDEVQERLRPSLLKDGVWYADYVRLRVLAVLQSPSRE